MVRVIGSNAHGNRNELKIVEALNQKAFSTLNNNLKEFVKYVAEDNNIELNPNTIIKAEYESNTRLKQDFYLYIENEKYCISLKMGSGNSVHQEKCEDFVHYIKNELNASDEICNNFRFFLWADGTLDGTGSTEKDEDGNIISRFTSAEFRERYPQKFEKLQSFLSANQEPLIRRFLFVGRHNSRVDYVYHGNEINGFWVSTKEIISYNIANSRGKGLHVGKLSLQAWNVSKKGNTEHKRGQLQVKYSQMENDFFSLMKKHISNVNTFLGNKEEFDISRRFNKNKTSPIWKELTAGLDSLDNVYMIKVSNRILSHLSNRKVYPKADAFLVECDFDPDYLLSKEYSLDESDLIGRSFKPIENTGISVKMNGSTGYTIQKLTYDSFVKAFSDIIDEPTYIFLALLLYSNDREKYKNHDMAKLLVIDEKEVKSYYIDEIGRDLDLDNIEDLSAIRNWAQKELKESIQDNIEIYKSLFTGSTWFDEPYVAHYVYINKKISENKLTDFSITTGSGRSKGKFSIEIKPIIDNEDIAEEETSE